MPTILRTSFNRNSSLSSSDNVACASRDSLPDPSEKLLTFLGTPSPDEGVHFPFPVSVHVSSLYFLLLLAVLRFI